MGKMTSGHQLNRIAVSLFLAGLAIVSLALLAGLLAPSAWAQSATGTISGLVTDQQNAAIAGAEVKLTDVATNTFQHTTTNEAGRYNIVSVPPDVCNLTVS